MFRFKRSQQENGRSRASFASVVTLALWRWRQTGILLFVITIGMVAAIVIVCAVPLFADVMTTAGLRTALRATPDAAEIEMDANTVGISTQVYKNVRDQLDTLVKQNMGSLVRASQFSFISTDVAFVSAPPPQEQRSLVTYGFEMSQVASHMAHLQGHVAQVATNASDPIDIMLTAATAKLLNVKVGDPLALQLNFYNKLRDLRRFSSEDAPVQKNIAVNARVAGIFTVDAANAAYWHGNNFEPLVSSDPKQKITYSTYTFIIPNESLLAAYDHARASINNSDAVFSVNFSYSLRWYYNLDPQHLSINDLDKIIGQLTTLQAAYQANYGDENMVSQTAAASPYLSKVALSSPLFSTIDTPSSLERFRSRIDVARIPEVVLALLIVLLILFFVSLMTNLLVDRQTESIAILRSRGASSGQIFGALMTQCVGLGLIAIVIGLPLSIATVIWLSQRILPANAQDALNFVSGDLRSALLSSSWYALGVILVVLLTMGISLFFAARMDVLSIRRQSARSNKRPLWQRLNLDVIAGVIALGAYGLSLYLTGIGDVLQGDAKTLISTPLSIIAPFFVIIGFMFLFLRIFPLLLRLAAYSVSRGRGAVSMLALAQISRSPRQSMRMMMLLALATAFALFTLVFTATQAQHIQDITTYQMGADMGGSYGSNANLLVDATKATTHYKAVPGVISVSAGFVNTGSGGKAGILMDIRAVDVTNFSGTVIWPSLEEQHAANPLFARLLAGRKTAVERDVLPAIIDTHTADKLLLHVGSTLLVVVDGMNLPNMNCVVAGIVPHIPTINDRVAPNNVKNAPIPGGILVDFQSYNAVYAHDSKPNASSFSIPDAPGVNYIWLHTKSDDLSLNSIRLALSKPELHLNNLADRWAFLATLNTDPLYVVLAGILAIGTVTALLLALVGDLLASWLSARTRLTNFAILRAIGTTPSEVARMLTWEQAIVYITGLLLGIAFGALLSVSMIPALSLTDLNTTLSNNESFYALQSAFPTRVIVPPSLLVGLVVLVVIYGIALTMMVRVVSQPTLGQALRLNED